MRQNYALQIVVAMILLFANVIAFNALFNRVRVARMDLTQDKIYTLAPETRELLQEPEEPLEIFFFHTVLDRMHEKLSPLVGPLSDIVREFGAASDGKVIARVVEWESADKATQARATEQFGVKPVPLQMQTTDEETVRNTYFSVVVAYGDQFQRFDQSDLYRIVQSGAGLDIRVELQNVEYLLAKAIYKVIRGFQSIGAALATHSLDATIELYFSPEAELPEFLKKVPGYAAKVSKKLADEAMGRLKVESIVIPDTEEALPLKKQAASKYKLRPIQVDFFSEKTIYSYAVVSAGRQYVPVPLITQGEEMTEFEVRESIEGQLKTLIPGFMMMIGVMTPDAKQNPMMAQMGQRQPPEEYREIVQALEAEFDVRRIDLGEGRPIPRQITTLLIIKPETFSDKALYEIDQFVMRGGRLVVCADGYSFDLDRAWQSQDPSSVRPVADGFKKFLRHMGADVGDSMILDTKSEIVRKVKQGTRRGEMEILTLKDPHFVYVETPDGFDRKHDISARQRFILLPWATTVTAAKAVAAAESREAQPGLPEGVTAREIAWTSEESSTSTDVARAESKEKIDYVPPKDAARHPVALVLTGVFPSYFTGKPIPGAEKADTPESAATRKAEADRGIKLDRSKDTSIVVIGDSDFVSPIVAGAFGLSSSLQHNVTFLRNAIDFGGPEAKLMPIRNRENVQRPLLALRGTDETGRQSRTSWARWLAIAVPCAVLLLLGGAWAMARMNRKPIALQRVRERTTRVTS